MKILVDQNISFRLIQRVEGVFSEILHVKDVNLMDANDLRIFLFARQEGFNAVLTLDEDFYNILLEYNAPPKIIWLRTGNCATAKLAEVVIRNEEIIHHFLKSADQDCLEIFQ